MKKNHVLEGYIENALPDDMIVITTELKTWKPGN